MQRIGKFVAMALASTEAASSIPETQSAAGSCPTLSAVQLDKDVLSASNTPATPPPAPPPEPITPFDACDKDTCKLIGDPHVTRFDRKWVSLLDTDKQDSDQNPGMKAGDYYVMKNSFIDIQATFGGNGPVLTKLLIGGNATDNIVLTIPTEQSPIKFGELEMFKDGDSFTGAPFGAMQGNVPLIQRSDDTTKTTFGQEFVFGSEEENNWVKLVVNRKPKSINVAISQCSEDSHFHEDIDKIHEDIAIGMCGKDDPGTTIDPNHNLDPASKVCDKGTCNVYGDPHITRFDRRWMSLIQLDGAGSNHLDRQDSMQKPGDFWLVQSSNVFIQARFGRNGPMMTHVAVGGPIMQGNVLVIGAKKDEATWNGQKILTDFPSTFVSDGGIARLTYSNQTSLVQRKDQLARAVPGVSVQLPDNVQLVVNRMPRSINLAITMCERTNQVFGGYCGNVEAGDDVMLADGQSPYEVGAGQSLFRLASEAADGI